MIHRPDRTEAAEYYFAYIDQVNGDDLCAALEAQEANALSALRAIGEETSLRRYAPDKWSIREAVSHINDCERLFTFRALWFARGFDSPLPSFDQDAAVRTAHADARPLGNHIAELAGIRSATRAFFEGLTDEDLSRTGTASGNAFTVRALGYITAGHMAHHMRVLRERYL